MQVSLHRHCHAPAVRPKFDVPLRISSLSDLNFMADSYPPPASHFRCLCLPVGLLLHLPSLATNPRLWKGLITVPAALIFCSVHHNIGVLSQFTMDVAYGSHCAHWTSPESLRPRSAVALPACTLAGGLIAGWDCRQEFSVWMPRLPHTLFSCCQL